MIASEPPLAIVWDEGYTLLRLERVRAWFHCLSDPSSAAKAWNPRRLTRLEDKRPVPRADEIDTRSKLFSQRNLAWFWPFAREEPHGHPPFYALVAFVGDTVAPSWGVLPRARLGTIAAFSLVAGGLFAFAASRWGAWPAIAACLAWVLHPHLFALGHYATYDGLLASLWLAALILFLRAAPTSEAARPWPRWGATIAFGLVLGCALATKFTAWLLPLPLLVWVGLYRSRAGLVAWLAGGVIAVAVFVALCPPLWANPIAGMVAFFESNLSRASTIPIKTRFLGHDYLTPVESLPWYNTVVWLFIASPILYLCLSLVGAIGTMRRWRAESAACLFVMSAAFLFLLRALPHTPGHDGTRQLAVGFGSLAPLCGAGAALLMRRNRRAGRLLVCSTALELSASVALLMPVPLSYFSPIVGGLPGAAAIGMEPTYYWDALTPAALQRIDARVPAGSTVLFAANPTAWYYKEAGLLRSGLYPTDGENISVYVVQNRAGSMSDRSRRLVADFGKRPESVIMEKFGVPLVWAFPSSELESSKPARGSESTGGR